VRKEELIRDRYQIKRMIIHYLLHDLLKKAVNLSFMQSEISPETSV
jgi:hypothetical protein